jgi:hypothetical protein
MRQHIKADTGSISIEKAAAMLGITPEELTEFCDQDTAQRYHHRTIYSNRIRFFEADVKKIRKQLTLNTTQQ